MPTRFRLIEQRERVEVSAGYTCDVVDESGEYNGEPFDVRQTNIRANHAALGPRGWGRAGPDVALRLDGAGNQIIDAPPRREERKDGMTTKRMVRVDGIEYEAGTDSHLQAIDRLLERKDGELAALKTASEAELAKVRKDLDATKGRLDGAELELKKTKEAFDAEKKRADAASSDEEVDKRIESRLGVIDRARRVLGADYEHSGKSERDIMADALGKAEVEVPEGASDDYVRGVFDCVTDAAADAGGDDEAAVDPNEPDEEQQMTEDRKDGKGRVRMSRGQGAPVGMDRVRADNRAWQNEAPKRFAMTKGN